MYKFENLGHLEFKIATYSIEMSQPEFLEQKKILLTVRTNSTLRNFPKDGGPKYRVGWQHRYPHH